MKWLKDKNGNKCSVEYFGSEEKAQKALDSGKEVLLTSSYKGQPIICLKCEPNGVF